MPKTKKTAGVTFLPDPARYDDPTGRADKVCRFIRQLTLWEGDFAGERFTLHPFQEAIVRRIYGPCDDDGLPLVRTACIWIPRGNAKTTLASALSLAHFLGPEAEAGGQVVMAAADRENAGIAFNCGWQFVKQEQALLDRVRPLESRKTLIHPKTNSVMKAISSESYTKQGMNVSLFLADEIHAWHPAEGRKLYGVVRDSMVKRSHPLTVVISTAGEGQGGVAYDLWEYSHAVARGAVDDPTFAPIIFAADPTKDWQDPEQWEIANPAIGAGFLKPTELALKAKRMAHFPAELADFKRYHLNLWQEGVGEPWIELDLYDDADPITPLEELEGRSCFVGVDLASVQDLTAVVAVFPDEKDGKRVYDVLAHFFLPADNIVRKSDEDQANYLKWEEEGYLTLTSGNVTDYREVWSYIEGLAKTYDLREVAIDRYNATATINHLSAEGIEVVEFGQGFVSMSAPVKELKRALLSRSFRHGGNPLLRMCFANVVATKDAAENEKFDKAKARGRIDGAVAAAMPIGRIIADNQEPSAYENRGFLFL